MQFDAQEFKYHLPLQLRWRDVDALQHVNNAVYLTYLEMARGRYFTDVYEWDWDNDGMILANVSINYRLPILLTDKSTILTRISQVGNKSFTMEYVITVERHGQILAACTATSVQVMYDYTTQQTLAIPPHLKLRIADYEGIEI
ncbi:MAG: acyl-CoA thioesterase [Chitinophagales bacterium]|nr:acyl-CoA thioesterase [Chitinophagales bacterium]